jgi:prepilin-type N-terminal cleavage/methylation domain-containing protein
VKSKSVKYNVTPLAVGMVYAPPLRIRRRLKAGFTLIEILVSVTIIATIISMVYGSYFATAKSADAYKARMNTSGQTQKVLRWMAQQIRCSYVGKIAEDTELTETDSSLTSQIKKNPTIYFSYEPNALGSGTLHMVTTHMLFCDDGYANGLVDVAYKFDTNSGTLSLSQRRFVGTPEKYLENRTWRPLLENVISVEFDFFDGRQWLKEWDFELKKKIPAAVKISITCEDKNARKCHYGTIAYVGCSGNSTREMLSETLVDK